MSEPITFTKKVKKKYKTYEIPVPLAPIADTHGHLYSFRDKTPEDAVVHAAAAGVQMLVVPVDPLSDRVDLARVPADMDHWAALAQETNPNFELYYLAGAHPYGAAEYTDETDAAVRAALAADPRCVGIGEIGLDYHFDSEDGIDPAAHEVQIEVMRRQYQIALDNNVPVELHLRHDDADAERTSHADAYDVLKEMGLPKAGCVLHCFGEDTATMQAFAELGCYIAYGGATTFKRNVETREAFAATPLDRIIFETDCPYMAPEPIRGLECEPAMITFTVDNLIHDRAERTGESPEEIAQAAWVNSQKLFTM